MSPHRSALTGYDMTTRSIAAALQRVATVLRRRPEFGLHDDAPATARWEGDTRVVVSHPNGTRLSTDMPVELGGSGDQVTPGWLFRAGLASCLNTSVAMAAAAEGIELTMLEVRADSRSDTRALLGMPDSEGKPVCAGPRDLHLMVRISARGVAPQRLRALVDDSLRCSPVPAAVATAIPMTLTVEVDSP
jgi:uncharacterized OsmC-like protein